MFAVYWPVGEGSLYRVTRRPRTRSTNVADRIFIPENRQWDSDEREWISKATGLYTLSPSYGVDEPDAWWKRLADEYCRTGDLTKAVGHAAFPPPRERPGHEGS